MRGGPLTNASFKNHLIDKYGAAGSQQIHHYETQEVRDQGDNLIVPAGLEVDEDFLLHTDPVQGKEVIASGITDGITNEQFETRL